MKPLIVFDVNETLLDLETLTPVFERVLGDKLAMRLWFANLILYSEALTLANAYVPFTDIGAAVLQMLAASRGIAVSEGNKRELTDAFAAMPPHREVPSALRRLRDNGFRLFTLTDNLLDIQTRQLEHGGVLQNFERRFSVDTIRRHKPAREAYAYVEAQLGVAPSELLLIASHTWDTIGAVAAGWHAALIKRPGNELLSVGPQPDLTGEDLTEIAEQVIEKYTEAVSS
jgi:2-haloacid dehalogenase